MFKKTLFLLSLFMPTALVQAMVCRDDPWFHFQLFTNGMLEDTYCKDINTHALRNRHCGSSFDGAKVSDRCPNACRTCPSGDGGCMTSDPEWRDSRGRGCGWYERNPGRRCSRAEEFWANFKTAAIVCCACGGGCANWPVGWHDAGGEHFNCEWYGAQDGRCEADGHRFDRNGFVANQACCQCGGGFEQIGGTTNNAAKIEEVEDSQDENEEDPAEGIILSE